MQETVLKSLFDPDVPEPAFVVRGLLVVTVFESSSHEWRLFVSYVVHAQCDRHIVQPGSPTGFTEDKRSAPSALEAAEGSE